MASDFLKTFSDPSTSETEEQLLSTVTGDVPMTEPHSVPREFTEACAICAAICASQANSGSGN